MSPLENLPTEPPAFLSRRRRFVGHGCRLPAVLPPVARARGARRRALARVSYGRFHDPQPPARRRRPRNVRQPASRSRTIAAWVSGSAFSVVIDPAANGALTPAGTYAWGGAASTVFWCDPVEADRRRVPDPAAAVEHASDPAGTPPAGVLIAGRLIGSTDQLRLPGAAFALTSARRR